jgi:replicative DNA helicase
MKLDRPQPHDGKIEKSIVAAMLLEPVPCIDAVLSRGVTDKSFFNPVMGLLFQRIIYLHCEKKELPDVLNLANDLKRLGRFEEIGGNLALCGLCDEISTTVGLDNWCGIILKLQASRMLLKTCTLTFQDAMTQKIGIKEIIERQKKDIAEIETISDTKIKKTTVQILTEAHAIVENVSKDRDRWIVPYCLYGFSDAIYHAKKEMHVLGAEANIGKTGFVLSIMNKQMEHGVYHALFCAETAAAKVMLRLISIESGIPLDVLYDFEKFKENKNYFARYQKAIEKLKLYSDKFFIFGKGDYKHNPEGIRREIRLIQEKTGGKLSMVSVDYLQNMRAIGNLIKAPRVEQIEEHVFQINEVFGEYNVAGILLSQISRDKESSRKNYLPKLADLKYSSTIEQEADYVTFLARNKEEQGDVKVQWYSDKVRGSKIIKTILDFNTHVGKFNGISGGNHRYSKNEEPRENNE